MTKSNKLITLISIILLMNSCNRLEEKHFKTMAKMSTSQKSLQFDLNADKTTTLILISQPENEIRDSNIIDIPDTIHIEGKWEEHGGLFYCDFKESEEFIEKVFFRSKMKTEDIIQNYNQVIFPITKDTIYIYGQPCISR